MIWWIENHQRFKQEREALEALAARENWLTPTEMAHRRLCASRMGRRYLRAGGEPADFPDLSRITFLSPLLSCSRAATTRAGRSISTVREANSALSTVRTTGIRTFQAPT